MESTNYVINVSLNNISRAAQSILPNHDAMRKIIRTRRNQINAASPTPENVIDLVIPDEYKFYEYERNVHENFLLADNGLLLNRILIFGRARSLQGPFVASFASTNLGDVSPNIKGPHCIDTGVPCKDVTSTCNGQTQQCRATGPGKDMYQSTEMIGTRLYTKALNMLQNKNDREVNGAIKIGHQYINMAEQVIKYTLPNGTVVQGRGCVPALGYSFAAGTTDGPGAFSFQQGTTSNNTFWSVMHKLAAAPTVEDIICQSPKPILFNTGRANFPYRWQPSSVSIQVAVLGNIVLAAVPSEFTTMSGRRLKETLKNVLLENGCLNNCEIIVAGLCNSYSSYVATYEEYQMQRYEGASTLYGPHTLAIYQDKFQDLLTSLLKNQEFNKGVPPKLVSDIYLWSFTLPVVFDIDLFNNFGDCLTQPLSIVSRGTLVKATFVSANPRTGNLRNYNLLEIQMLIKNAWKTVATEADWETTYEWKRTGFASSQATVTWFVNINVPTGQYRIGHYGYYKPLFGHIQPFNGFSDRFTVV